MSLFSPDWFFCQKDNPPAAKADSPFVREAVKKCEIWKARREGTPPPITHKEFQATLEARCLNHRANFFTAPGDSREMSHVLASLVLSPIK